jgi:hypothetical protein
MAYNFNPFTGNFDEVGSGASVAGSDTEIQYNDSGSLGASADLTWDDSGKVLGVEGDINLDDGGTYTTTLQTITPTAARTISFPDATGTVALVAGSSGQLLYNNAGAVAGLSSVTTDGTNVTLTGRFISSLNGAASAPPGTFTGTWFTGGTATTTKPQVLVEPTGATSTAWSTSGTGLGVNAANGFAGRLLDLQVNGTSNFNVSSTGAVSSSSSISANGSIESAGRIFAVLGGQNGVAGGLCNFSTSFDTFIFCEAGNTTLATVQSAVRARISAAAGFLVGSTSSIGFTSGALATTSRDTFITRHSAGFIGASVAFNSNTLVTSDAAETLAQRNGTNAQTLRVYGTFTDASNYVRASLSSTSTAVTLAAQTAGTGADDIPLNLTAAGTGTVKVNSNLEIADAKNIVLATGTGTKIGTATTQKLGFWDKTPVVQPTTGISGATFVADSGGSIHPSSTFDGYTIAQVVAALRQLGILA